jgi:hypothetical protein
VFGQRFVWVTYCYAVKFLLSYNSSNLTILWLQMRLMCWDVDIVHRLDLSNNPIVHGMVKTVVVLVVVLVVVVIVLVVLVVVVLVVVLLVTVVDDPIEFLEEKGRWRISCFTRHLMFYEASQARHLRRIN